MSMSAVRSFGRQHGVVMQVYVRKASTTAGGVASKPSLTDILSVNRSVNVRRTANHVCSIGRNDIKGVLGLYNKTTNVGLEQSSRRTGVYLQALLHEGQRLKSEQDSKSLSSSNGFLLNGVPLSANTVVLPVLSIGRITPQMPSCFRLTDAVDVYNVKQSHDVSIEGHVLPQDDVLIEAKRKLKRPSKYTWKPPSIKKIRAKGMRKHRHQKWRKKMLAVRIQLLKRKHRRLIDDFNNRVKQPWTYGKRWVTRGWLERAKIVLKFRDKLKNRGINIPTSSYF